MRRAKVDFADKEKIMGHKIGLENNYERYIETDFENFPEYQKAIPLLTISNEERAVLELAKERSEKNILIKKNIQLEEKQKVIDKMQTDIKKLESDWIDEHFPK